MIWLSFVWFDSLALSFMIHLVLFKIYLVLSLFAKWKLIFFHLNISFIHLCSILDIGELREIKTTFLKTDLSIR